MKPTERKPKAPEAPRKGTGTRTDKDEHTGEAEHDVGYGRSHGYGPGHGGPSGPGDVPGDENPFRRIVPRDDEGETDESDVKRPSETGPS